jgi:hypothetical protein
MILHGYVSILMVALNLGCQGLDMLADSPNNPTLIFCCDPHAD